MAQLIHWLTDYQTVVNSLSSIVGALSTLVISILTVFLWLENRALRKAGSEPKVVAHFEIHPNGSGAIDISLSNVGNGPAFDVNFYFNINPSDAKKYGIVVNHSESIPPMTLIHSGSKFTFLFGIGFNLLRPKDSKNDGDALDPLKPFSIKVEWRNLHGKKYTKNYPMDIMQFNGLPGIFEKPPLFKVVDSLDRIGNEIVGLRYKVNEITSIVDITTIAESAQRVTSANSPRHNESGER